MAEELNLDHFDLGTFVDYVHALKQERDALRAQLPSQGGEAVEVVGYQWLDTPHYRKKLPAFAKNQPKQDEFRPLMTVAQHQRILAASVGGAEPVGVVLTEKQMGIGYDQRIGPVIWFGGYPKGGSKLYTHPGDQVVEGVVVSRELLDSLMTVIDSNGYAADEVEVVDDLRALLASLK